MNDWFSFIDSLVTKFGYESAVVNLTLKVGIALGAAVVCWFVVKGLLYFVERRARKLEMLQINPQAFKIVRKGSFYVLVLVTGTYLLKLINMPSAEKAFYAVVIILMANPIKEFLAIAFKSLEHHVASKTETKVDNIIFELMSKFTGAIIYATAIVLSLDMLGVNVMPFIAGAGVAGIAVGFAAKDTLSNLIAGVLLILDRPFEMGDRIEVWSAPRGTATWGDVIDIGLRATKIRTTDNLIIVIPNNEIMKRDIVNYTLISSRIRVRIDIGVAYDTNIKKAKSIILNVADSLEWILKDPAPKVVVRNFGESSVDLQLRVWIKDARKRMDTISSVTDEVKERFDQEGVEIPYPKRDITITHKE
ncbi:mechanosensitive ion channel family protein [Thermodesulfobacteriota bacterium]